MPLRRPILLRYVNNEFSPFCATEGSSKEKRPHM